MSGLKIVPIFSGEARSVGDAMREIDSKQILSSDFILVTGDIVSNLRIEDILKEHKERRKASKNPIMTMVMREVGPRDRPRQAKICFLYSKLEFELDQEGRGQMPSSLYWIEIRRNVYTTITFEVEKVHSKYQMKF